MATSRTGAKAVAMCILFVISGPLSHILYVEDNVPLALDDNQKKPSSVFTDVILNGPSSTGVGPTLSLESDHALQTIQLAIEAGYEPRSTGFNWTDWDLPGFSKQGLVEEDDGSLILGFQGVTWDFDKGTNGWTTSSTSFGQRNTATTCGMSGGSGASWWTRGGAVTVTSPQVDLTGHQGLAVQAWIKQGNSGCGEEPDSNENFYLEYKNSNNGWGQIQYLAGSSIGGSVTNVNYNLPADAYHSTFQVRARQNSGSGTCCDYWFFDDIILPGTNGANLTSRSFGWSSGVDELIEKGRYSPIFIDANIPENAHLNWTVVDANTNTPVPGMENRNGQHVDLSVVDWKVHQALRLVIHFATNELGQSPKLYGISGGGKFHHSFSSDVQDLGWEFHNASWNELNLNLSGTEDSTLFSPLFDLNMPFSEFKLDYSSQGIPDAYYALDHGNWMPFSPSNTMHSLDGSASVIQFKFESNGSIWSIDDFNLQMRPTRMVVSPSLDVDGDGRYEWSVVSDGIGSWGNQDVFMDNNESSIVDVGFNPTSWHNILIPRSAKSFEVSAEKISNIGLGVQTVALWIGNTMIAQTGDGTYHDGLRLSLNSSNLDMLNYETSKTPAIKQLGGNEFILAKIELISDAGQYRLGGLSIGYEASQIITSTGIDDLVLSINRARLDSSKSTNLPLLFRANSVCSMKVAILSQTSSNDVTMGTMTWKNDSRTLTPSQNWREMNMRANVYQSSPDRLLVNMYSDDYEAMWFIPIVGGSTISTGYGESLVFSDSGIQHNINSDIHDFTTLFRTSQSFDDQTNLRIETRLQLTNGFVSMPLVKTWYSPAVDNDMRIDAMAISTDNGVLSHDSDYLMAEQNVTIMVDVGFENGNPGDKPYPGEFELTLSRNGEVISNTSGFEGQYWVVETKAPFISGNVTYEAKLSPLAGGDTADPHLINRTFIIDPLAPVVVGANIRHFDHLQSSNSQEIIINISDQPELPEEVTLMLWTEWANDLDGDGWPSEGEYIPRALTPPIDRSTTFGDYTTLIDDTAAFPGEKVAGYVLGEDPSGHTILDGGSDSVDDHLFMYQIMSDGAPLIASDGFEWEEGRKAWLHPGQTYGLNLSFTEKNGIADIREVEISLADNIASDPLIIRWNSDTRSCMSETIHLEVSSCNVYDNNGLIPGPFDQNLVLNIQLIPQWTLPDLGETRREPVLRIYDRADNYDEVSFPQNRWRFSAEMMIQDTLSLWVENGDKTEEGARVSPGSTMELSGEVVFFRSMERPHFDCDVEVRLNGVRSPSTAVSGIFTASIYAPMSSGQHAMTWAVDCLPEQGIDKTSPTEAVMWILVDAVGPEVVEFSSPRESSTLSLDSHNITVVVSENYGIDVNSVKIFWWITAIGSQDSIASGDSKLDLVGDVNTGLRLEFTGVIDITDVASEFLHEQTQLKVRLEGRDIAGNQFETEQNSRQFPAHIWYLEHYKPIYSIERSGVELSKSSLEVDEPTIVQVHIRNDGKLSGDADILVEAVNLNGDRSMLSRSFVFIEAESVSTLIVDWKPSDPGIQRIEVTLEGETQNSEFIDVKPIQEKAFLEESIGATNPWILGTTMTMICVGLLYVLSWMRLATVNQGEDEIEWEYEDEEFED